MFLMFIEHVDDNSVTSFTNLLRRQDCTVMPDHSFQLFEGNDMEHFYMHDIVFPLKMASFMEPS